MAKSKIKTDSKKKTAKTAKPNGAAESAATAEAEMGATRTGPAEFVSRNAVPLGLVAAGIGILAARNISGGENAVTKAAERGRRRLAGLAEAGSGKARKGAVKLGKGAEKGVARTKRTVAEHPVAAGVAAAAVGAGLAVAVPKMINRGRS